MYRPHEIDQMISRLVCIVDSREQPTEKYYQRLNSLGMPYERLALPYGDYSAYTTDPDGGVIDLRRICSVERKMGLDELANCFTHERERFTREFERAKSDGCHMHILIENDSFERLRFAKYRSKLPPQALIASLLTWGIRYNAKLMFCKSETTGYLVGQILRYELREYLLNMKE